MRDTPEKDRYRMAVDPVNKQKSSPKQHDSNKYRCTARNYTYMYEAASRTAKKLGNLARDEVVEKLGKSEDGEWIKFRYNDEEGWAASKYLKKIPYIPPPGEDFPWMPIAEKEIGVNQIEGEEHNPRILEYLNATTNLDARYKSMDETSWCSAFVNWCLEQAGYERTENALARSWLRWGKAIESPRRGCIVVFEREENFGHVAFYLDETESHLKVLGGNQTNPETGESEVCIKEYPKDAWLGYRIPD
jgi:uncharacterized protein (TIGR02594 family)